MKKLLFLFILIITISCGEEHENEEEIIKRYNATELYTQLQKLVPFHKKLGAPQPGDWLASHKEAGQTFAEYLTSNPVVPTKDRPIIYIQPLGDFTETQRKIIDLTGEYMRSYFDCEVKVKPDISLSAIPLKARRIHPVLGNNQILTTYVLDELLKPKLPSDAAVYIAFTASDLWPGKGWNFVFGMASLSERVGVWSIYRNGNPDESEEAFRKCLVRTLKTATHETGHMFSMQHCIAWTCNMNGANNQLESDNSPLWLCPECVSKVNWAKKLDPIQRYQSLLKYCNDHQLSLERKYFENVLRTLSMQ